MTISSTTARNRYEANGVTTVFAYQFKIFDEADLKVYADDVLQVSGYTVDGVENDGGGNVTFSTAPANGVIIVLKRQLDIVQPLDLPTQGSFPSDSVEAQFDKIVMMLLDLDERLGRAFIVALSSTLAGGIDVPLPEAGKALGWNSAEDGLTNLEPESGALVSAAMAGPVAAASTSAFLTAVGGTTVGKALFTAATELAARTTLLLDGLLVPNSIINGGMQVAQRGAPNLSTSYQYGKVDRWAGRASAGSVSAGTVTQSTSSAASSSGFALHFSGITLTGSAKLAARYRIEAKDAVRLKNQTAIFSARTWHDVGSSKNATITVNKPTVADDFTSVTLIGASGSLAVADQTATAISHSLALGDCSNGLEIIVELDTGAMTTKNWHLAEACLIPGTAAPATFPGRPFAIEVAACRRYFEKTFAYGIAPVQNGTSYDGALFWRANGTSQGGARWTFKVTKRAAPTIVTFNPSQANANWRNITAGADGTAALGGNGPAAIDDGVVILCNTSGSNNDQHYLHATADAEL